MLPPRIIMLPAAIVCSPSLRPLSAMDYADECFFSLLRLTELIGQYSFRMCLLIVGSDVQIMLMLSHCNRMCISQTESTLGRKDYMKVRQSSEGRAYTEVM